MTTSNMVRVLAAVLDTHKLKLHLDSGKTIEIKQGDPRLKEIVDKVLPAIRSQGYADISIGISNQLYSQVEEKTGGVLKFFRIAREKLNQIFSREAKKLPSFEMVGNIYNGPESEQKLRDAAVVDEIMQHAVHTEHVNFSDIEVSTTDQKSDRNVAEATGDTIIAVVNGSAVIEDAHKIKHQLSHAIKTENTEGIENFYKRLAAIIDKRRHNAKDLMQFCMKGDLQFADDGSIIVYKSLRDNGDGWFVDIHSGRVTQNVGTRVYMQESMVDQDRRNECSNGLHIARRQYVGTFSGNALFICTVAPEDVIAVPEYDANKMRVCGYNVIFQLPKDDERAVRTNKPVHTEEGMKMLAAAKSGDFAPMHRFVEICGERGTKLNISTLDEKPEEVDISNHEGISPLDFDENNNVDGNNAEAVSVEEVANAVAPEKPKTKRQQAEELYDKMMSADSESLEEYQYAKEIEAIKKRAKISWMNLLDEIEAEDVLAILEDSPHAKATVEVAKEPEKVEAEPVPSEQERIDSLVAGVSLPAAGTPRIRIAQLMSTVRGGNKKDAKAAWEEVKKLKKEAKKSWEYFGVTDVELLNEKFTK